jgi:Raf kinase inhibitor-like YbhB/YbcL family protein
MPVNPYDRLPPVDSFTIWSKDIQDGEQLPLAQYGTLPGVGGEGISPHLAWSGFPAGTRSFAVTMYDPEAPTPSGFWHWAVIDIPSSVHELPSGAATVQSRLPSGAVQLPNDVGIPGYLGAAPPFGRDHYYVVVHALDVESLGVPPATTPACMSFGLLANTLARAVLVAWAESPVPVPARAPA